MKPTENSPKELEFRYFDGVLGEGPIELGFEPLRDGELPSSGDAKIEPLTRIAAKGEPRAWKEDLFFQVGIPAPIKLAMFIEQRSVLLWALVSAVVGGILGLLLLPAIVPAKERRGEDMLWGMLVGASLCLTSIASIMLLFSWESRRILRVSRAETGGVQTEGWTAGHLIGLVMMAFFPTESLLSPQNAARVKLWCNGIALVVFLWAMFGWVAQGYSTITLMILAAVLFFMGVHMFHSLWHTLRLKNGFWNLIRFGGFVVAHCLLVSLVAAGFNLWYSRM
jgi:hypothetical protein